MFPVLAEHEIQVIQHGRREALARAERIALNRSLAASTAAPTPGRRPLRRVWTALGGVVGAAARTGHLPTEARGGRAVARS